jgi:hypothetical protein
MRVFNNNRVRLSLSRIEALAHDLAHDMEKPHAAASEVSRAMAERLRLEINVVSRALNRHEPGTTR